MAEVAPRDKPASCEACGSTDLQWNGMGYDRAHDPEAEGDAPAVEQVITGRIDAWKCARCGHTVHVKSRAE
jgi:DNA-directed RNA polymerase subunit RPC12/RpoP